MNSALPSANSLLSKLQQVYSSNKKSNGNSISPAPRPFVTKEINKLLEKSSPIPYLNVKKTSDVAQWTERIIKSTLPQEKQQSCSSFIANDTNQCSSIHLQKYSQVQCIQEEIIPILQYIEKKIKLFKYAKENDQNTCAAIIAKIKLFCLDNSQQCYDFYRSTDLILLKYMIFLLIQELNQKPQQKQENNNIPIDTATYQFQQQIKDVIGIVYEIIEEVKTKFMGVSMDTLNRQLRQIQSQLTNQYSKSAHQRFNSCDLEKKINQFSDSSEKLYNKKNIGSQKKIQFQIDQLENNKQSINKLNEQIIIQQKTNNKQLLQIADLNNQIKVQHAQNELLKQELLETQKKLDNIIQENNQIMQKSLQINCEKEDLQNNLQILEEEHQTLQQEHDQLMISNQTIEQEFDLYKKETHNYYVQQFEQLQKAKNNEIEQLKIENNEKQSIIQQVVDDALYFGKLYKILYEKMLNINDTQQLQQLHRELFIQDNTINAKLNAINNFSDNLLGDCGIDYLSQSQISTTIAHKRRSVSQQNGQSDMLNMLLIQSLTLEKFLE